MTSDNVETESKGNEFNIDWTSEASLPPYSPDPKIRRFGKRTPAAAHRGFGFGANTIREKSLQVARESNNRKNTRLQELLSEPVSKSTHPTVLESAPAIVAPAPAATNRSKRVFSRVVTGVIPPKTYGSKNQSSAISHAQNQPSSVTVGRAALAWILDTVVACSAFVISMGASYASTSLDIGTPLFKALDKLTAVAGAGNPFLLVMVFKVLVGGLGMIFVSQLIMLLATGSTAGRFAMGVRFEKKGFWARIIPSTIAALSETLTMGGVLALPFVLSIPSRVPLAPWIRFESQPD